MFDRKAWESARPITCRGTGMGDALDAWHADAQPPKELETYDQFVKAKALYNQFTKAIATARKKLAGKNSTASDEANVLLKNAESELEKYQKDVAKEYGLRISRAQEQIAEANNAVDKSQEALDRELEMFKKMLKSIEQKCTEVETGKLTGPSAQQGAAHLLKVVKESKSLTKDGFDVFRNKMVNSEMRTAGAKGICEQQGLGGAELGQVKKIFEDHMDRFRKLESTFDAVVNTQRECVMGVKKIATLLEGTSDNVTKQEKILTTFATGLAKAYEAMSVLTSKRMSIHGPMNARQAVDYFDNLEVDALKTDQEAMKTNVGVLRGYIQQLTALKDRAEVVFDKAVKGVPEEIKEESPIAEALEELTTKYEEATKAAANKIIEWNEMINTLDTYLDRAYRALKSKTK